MNCSTNRVFLLGGLLALASAAGGCQSKQAWNLAPVEGTVTKEGQPLAHIQVIFLADVEAGTQGPRARGTTDEAGRYRLHTDNGDIGAVVGQHRVRLVDPEARPNAPGENRRVPPSYESFRDTPVQVEVRPGRQIIDVVVK